MTLLPSEIQAPSRIRPLPFQRTVFLAGAIDMGTAEDWQAEVVKKYVWDRGTVFYNPRRNDWDASWVQSADNPQFAEQVEWELDKIDEADIILMYFPAASKAPITLMEFGIAASRWHSKLIVAAEDGYWRRGNIEVVCRRERIELHNSLPRALMALETRL